MNRGPFVTALGRTWCPAHFLCVNQNCRRELMDIGFVEEKGDLYCEYCFEQFLAPPCSKCNGKIKVMTKVKNSRPINQKFGILRAKKDILKTFMSTLA